MALVFTLQIAAAQCSSGQSTGGLTSELNIALQSLYERFACELYHKAAAGYTLQSLYHMYKHHGASMMAALHSFTRSALEVSCANLSLQLCLPSFFKHYNILVSS